MPYKFNPISGQMDYYQASTGASDVTSSAVIADDVAVRGDGGVRGVQGSTIIIDDTGSMVVPSSITVGETSKDVTFTINGVAIEAVAALHTSGLTDLGGFVEERHSNTSTLGAHNLMLRSRGTEGATTVVQNADIIGRLVSCGYDGTDFAQSAEIRTSVDGTPGANDMPGKIELFTSADGSQSPTLGFTLDSSQNVTLANALPVASGGTGAATLTGVLTGNGTSAVTANTITEFGVLVGDASNAVTSTAVGTATEVLTSNGAGVAPTFQAAAGGLSWNSITSGSLSGTSTAITSGLGTAYDEYLFIIKAASSTSNNDFQVEISDDAGVSYAVGLQGITTEGADTTNYFSAQPLVLNGGQLALAESVNVLLYLRSNKLASYKSMDWNLSGAGIAGDNAFGTYTLTNIIDVDAVRFSVSAGNFDSGTYVVYGR